MALSVQPPQINENLLEAPDGPKSKVEVHYLEIDGRCSIVCAQCAVAGAEAATITHVALEHRNAVVAIFLASTALQSQPTFSLFWTSKYTPSEMISAQGLCKYKERPNPNKSNMHENEIARLVN